MFWRGFNETSYEWFDSLDVQTNVSFETVVAKSMCNATVQVDWSDHSAIMLFAHPGMQQDFDNWIRSWNPHASVTSGTVDECGWPANPAAPIQNQNTRATTCFYEDFSKGWDPARVTLSLNHGCCMEGSYPMPNGTFYPPNGSPDYSGNIGIETQDEEYPAGIVRRKNVMRLTAVNHDMAACALPDCQQYARACFWACCCVLSCVVAC